MEEVATTQTVASATNETSETPAAGATTEQPTSAATSETVDQPKAEAAPQTPPARRSLRELLETDPELRAEYHRERHAYAQSYHDKQSRKTELARAREDPTAALEFVQKDYERVEAEESQESQLRTAQTEAEAELKAKVFSKPALRDLYLELHRKESGKLTEMFNRSPQEFLDYVGDQLREMEVDRRAEEKAKRMAAPIADALATSRTNETLQGLPVPPGANGAGAHLPTLREIENMSPEEYASHRANILANLGRYRRQ